MPLSHRKSMEKNKQEDDLLTLVMLNPPIALFDEEDRQAYKNLNGVNKNKNKMHGKNHPSSYPDFLEENQ